MLKKLLKKNECLLAVEATSDRGYESVDNTSPKKNNQNSFVMWRSAEKKCSKKKFRACWR
jgi:hypothetical protein